MPSEPSAPLKIGTREVKVTHPERVLYPKTGFTKGDLINYYARIGPTMVPYLKGRTVTRKRYPEGVDKLFFFEKNCPPYKPSWMETARIASHNERGRVDYCVVNDVAGLVWLANLAAIELHTALAKVTKQDRPTVMVFDFDPGPPAGMLEAIAVAFELKKLLEKMGLECFAKTSGGKGLHVYVPLNTAVTFDQTKAVARTLAEHLEKQGGEGGKGVTVTSSMSKAEREGKVFIDWSQNDEHKTTACAYTMRARERPTVSTPVTWKELQAAAKKKSADGLVFEASDVLQRVEKLGDLFEPVLKLKQKLP